MKKISLLSSLLAIASASSSQTSTFDNLNANLGSPKNIEWYSSNYGSTANNGPNFGFGHKIFNETGNGETYLKIAGKHNANTWKDLITIKSTGQVGIGTNLPSCMLDIVDPTRAELKLFTTGNSEAGVWVLNNLRSYGFRVNGLGDGCITQAYNTVNAQGGPYELLNFTYDLGASPPRPQVWIGSAKPTTPNTDFAFSAQGKMVAKSLVIGQKYYGGTSQSEFVVMENGQTCVGCSNPGTFMLAVEGKIGAREIKVTLQNPWPDFVFEKNYKLASLSQVEDYISKNKHLPNVPSADELQKDKGVDLGKMQNIQMQKIEELFLYVIELKKENEILSKKINEIEASK